MYYTNTIMSLSVSNTILQKTATKKEDEVTAHSLPDMVQ